MEVDHDDDDDDDDNDDEYATLSCQWPGAAVATAVHLKATFFDRQRTTVFRANAVIVGHGAAADSNGAYEGCVLREQAATASGGRVKSSTGDDAENVRVWLRDARAALFGRGDDDGTRAAEYVYALQTPSGGNDPAPLSLRLSWKMKLRPIGLTVLGSVQLFRVPGHGLASLAPVSSRFIGPLIRCLLEERERHRQADLRAAANAEQLLDDNRRLLDRLRSAADSRQQDDRRLISRFVEVLNAKKRRLVAIQQELSELKQQQQRIGSMAVTDTESREITVQQRGRKAKSNTTPYGKQLNDTPVVIKKRRPRTMQSSDNKWCSILPEEEEQRVDDVEIVKQNNEGKELNRLDKNIKMDDKSSSHIINIDRGTSDERLEMGSPSAVDVFDADTQIDYPDNDEKQPQQVDLMEINRKSSSVVNNINNIIPSVIDLKTAAGSPEIMDYFTADTLDDGPVNNTTPNSSPPWFQQQTTDTEMLQKSLNKDFGCQQPKMNNSPPWFQQQTTDTEMLQKSPNKDFGCQQPKMNNSPPWFQQQTTDTAMLQKSPNKDIGCQQTKKKNVLDDLWSGIL